MQSNGRLWRMLRFSRGQYILSGPAGGIVRRKCKQTLDGRGLMRLSAFDMVELLLMWLITTRDDVTTWNWNCRYVCSGGRFTLLQTGGGSIFVLWWARYQLGPESSGANPDSASYSKGGPLTVTIAETTMVGKLQPEFNRCFGKWLAVGEGGEELASLLSLILKSRDVSASEQSYSLAITS